MNKENRWDDQGMYHEDEIRLESYGETADKMVPDIEGRDVGPIDSAFVDRVVQQVQHEISPNINNYNSVNEIKIQAMHRFLDLIEKQLLSQREAERCYQRFVQLVHYYYGT